MDAPPMTVHRLQARLRTLVPRLGRRDREIVLDAVGGLAELAKRLHAAETALSQAEIELKLARSGKDTLYRAGEVLANVETQPTP